MSQTTDAATEITKFLEDVHVGYALAAGKFVSDQVISEYLDHEKSVLKGWHSSGMYLLLRFPALRGAVTFETANSLSEVLAQDSIELSDDTMGRISEVMKSLPRTDLTATQVDDHLYRNGLLRARQVLVRRPIDRRHAYSDLALKMSEEIRIFRQRLRVKDLSEKRGNGDISLREFENGLAHAVHGNELSRLTYANDIARAVAEKNLPLLLSFLDKPDDLNIPVKRTLTKELGFKLIGLTSQERRRAIFEFCDYSPQQQLEWEAAQKAERDFWRGEVAVQAAL